MSIERTQQVVNEIKTLGGEIAAMHALLGEYDLLFCIRLPAVEDAIKASVNLNRLSRYLFYNVSRNNGGGLRSFDGFRR